MSETISIRALAEQAKREGAVDLAMGLVEAQPPNVLINALKTLPVENCSDYGPKLGAPAFRTGLKKYLNSRKWDVELNQIMGASGAMGAISAAMLECPRPGRVILPEPFFVYHKLLFEKLGFDIDYLTLPMDGPPDWDYIEHRMKDADALVLTNPANPSGHIAPVEILKRLSNAAVENSCFFIIDETYREFIWDDPPEDDSRYAEMNYENCALVRSFSKTFSIPGWRVGYAVTSPERVESMSTAHDGLYIGGSTIAQHAMAKVLDNNIKELDLHVSELRKILLCNKGKLAKAFTGYGMEPIETPATYFMLVKHNRESDMAAVKELLEKKIVVTPANILFSNPGKDTGFIRIHFAIKPENCDLVVNILNR